MQNSSAPPVPIAAAEDVVPPLPSLATSLPIGRSAGIPGVGATTMALDMSLEEMLAVVARKHRIEVEACSAQLLSLREKNFVLTKQLQVFHNAKVQSNATTSARVVDEEAARLPNTVATTPREASGEGHVANLEDISPVRSPGEPVAFGREPAWASDWEDAAAYQAAHAALRRGASATKAIGDEGGRGAACGVGPRAHYFRAKDVWEPNVALEGLRDQASLSHGFGVRRSPTWFGHDGGAKEDSRPMLTEGIEKAWYIGLPTNPERLAWDLVGAVLIFYDLIMFPMQAFSPPETTFTIVMEWFVLFFWTANVGASLTVAHVEHGEIVVSPSKIALRYLKTWFVVDLLVVVPDWVFTIIALADRTREGGGGEESVKLLRVLRLIRVMRTLRLRKLRKISQTFNDVIDSEYVSVIANIFKMIIALLVINHLICCVWFLLAESQKHHDSTWTTFYGFDDAHWLYKYSTSFHWSITQFTPASMHVQPQNNVERTFTIVVVVFALVGFSYIVGSITGSLGQLRSMHAEESKLFWDVRRFLKKNNVNRRLSMRIQKYLEHAWQVQQDQKPVKDVKLMQFLSDQLRAELQYALAVNQLQIHPFFDHLSTYSSITIHRLANCAISHKLLAVGDAQFHLGEAATHMYIVVEGNYVYRRSSAKGELRDERVDRREDWIAEPALWTKSWIHLGVLVAIKEGDNLTIDARGFGEQVSLNPQAHLLAMGYAQSFVIWLNTIEPDDLTDICQGEDVGELFKAFIPTDVFDPLGTASARLLRSTAGVREADIPRLD